MASATATEASDEAAPPMLRLLRHQDLSLFLPYMLGLSDHHPPPPPSQSDRIVLINPVTQGTVILDSLPPSVMRSANPPASSSSIEALPTVEIAAESGDRSSASAAPCCVICLEEWGAWTREMPCRHRFHGDCIERWLRLHGSCPVCRYRMPVDEAELRKLTTTDTGYPSDPPPYNYHGRRETEVWVSFSFSRNTSLGSGDLERNPPLVSDH